jgi:RHS repeat-associated protein
MKQGASAHFAAMDGNGNVMGLVDGALGDFSARYEYDTFGQTIRLTGTGTIAQDNRYRFSTKRAEPTTGLILYEYRVYDPVAGRWLSRDPIEEDGGLNMHNFARNSAINIIDILGLYEWIWLSQSFQVHWSDSYPVYNFDLSYVRSFESIDKWLKGDLRVPYRCREFDKTVVWGNAYIENTEVDWNTWFENLFGLKIVVSGLSVSVGLNTSVVVNPLTSDPDPSKIHPDRKNDCKTVTRVFTITVKRGASFSGGVPVVNVSAPAQIEIAQHQVEVPFTATCCFCPTK